jgi:hypothetical protein
LIWRTRLLIGFVASLLLLSLSACGTDDPYNTGDPVVIHHHSVVHHTVIHHTVVHHVHVIKVRPRVSLRKR